MNIDWAALGSVFGVSLVATVALVGLFTLGIVGLSKSAAPRQGRRPENHREHRARRAYPCPNSTDPSHDAVPLLPYFPVPVPVPPGAVRPGPAAQVSGMGVRGMVIGYHGR
ncbi:hypothetical protein AB0R12_28560 [Streptomyces niveus]|uniref:hypothetical protein n=1 Tax=Streptomyces niveus TaxID=193462 RepID=UPI003420E107